MNKILFSFLIILIVSCQKKTVSELRFHENLELVNTGEGQIKPCLHCQKKLVAYFGMNNTRSLTYFQMTLKTFKKIPSLYPDLNVIYVFGGKNVSKGLDQTFLEEFLLKHEVPFAVLYDEENTFFDLNNLQFFPYELNDIQIYLVDDQKFVESAEPGVPELFDKQVKQFLSIN